MNRTAVIAGLAACLALAGAAMEVRASSARLEGAARVVDGDTLKFGRTRVRLEAVDAPERAQRCEDARGRGYPCGLEATEALRALIRGREVRCDLLGRDLYERAIARCEAGGRDLGRAMVLAGWARAGGKLADRYAGEEAEARRGARGVWAGRFENPWDWRAARRETRAETREAAKAERCTLKGNISENGRIFHAPGQRWYARTRIDEAKGERWFCSVEEARAAGWRAARR